MGDKKAEKEFIAEFIEVYRGLPALWDVKCKDYTNRAKKGEQYDVLIEKYREKYPDAEKQEVLCWFRNSQCITSKRLPEFRVTDYTTVRYSSIDSYINHHELIVDDESRQKNRKRKAPDPTEELVKLASKRLQQPQDDSDIVAAAWAVELRKMDPQQQLFAKKAINEILFEGQMGTLHRSSVEINVSRVATPYSVQSLPSPSFPQYESASASSQHTGGYYTTLH
ncbi:uncharacterized protein LOC134777210 [Penaeus indicus]|uniref:uncharacterized protein LOC134777210 n=1 Tax=Penaeus indicus TaxID=29960 RepID=UPI00300DB2F2